MSQLEEKTKYSPLPETTSFGADCATLDVEPFGQLARAELAANGWARIELPLGPQCSDITAMKTLITQFARTIGVMVPQSFSEDKVSFVRDEGKSYTDHRSRGHHTNAALPFHSDRCDINILLYLSSSNNGGELSVVSYAQAAQALKGRDAGAYAELFNGFPFDLREERIFPSIKWLWRPILWQASDGVERGHYIRRFISDCARHLDAPQLTQTQFRALEQLDQILAELREANSFLPRIGDLVILDNYRVMHARSNYDDTAEAPPRLALRAWVAPYQSERLPPFLHPMTGSCEPGCFRGGVGSGEAFTSRLGSPISKDNED